MTSPGRMQAASYDGDGGAEGRWDPPAFRRMAGPVARLSLRRRREFLRPFLDYLVDDAEVLRHVCGEEGIALQRVLDLLELLPRVLHVDLVQPLLQVQDFLRVQHDVGRLALE